MRRWVSLLASLVLLGTGLLHAEPYTVILVSGESYQALNKYRQQNGMICFNVKADSQLCFPPEQVDLWGTATANGEEPPQGARRIFRYEDGTWGYDPPSVFKVDNFIPEFKGDAPSMSGVTRQLVRDLSETKSYLVPSLELSRYKLTTIYVLILFRLLLWLVTFLLALFYLDRLNADVSRLGLAFYMVVSILLQMLYLELGAMLFGWIGFSLLIMFVLDGLQWRFLGTRIQLDEGESISLSKFFVFLEVITVAVIWIAGYTLL